MGDALMREVMSRRILVVEDDVDTLRGLTARLQSYGFEVATAGDAYFALQRAKQFEPDVVLLDLGLPGGDGLGVIERMKNVSSLRSIPIIVVSARDTETWRNLATAAGAVEFLAKPLDNAALKVALFRHMPVSGEEKQVIQSNTRILLVEDDADTRMAMAVRLRSGGFEVSMAADASSALTVALKEKPDVIILDLGLPGGNGLGLMQRMKSNLNLASVPVIILSAWDRAVHEQRAKQAGAFAYFEKPADNAELLKCIGRAVSKR